MSRLPRRMARRLSMLAVLVAALGLLAGCGNRHEEPRTFAETEGLYLEIGDLEYQIQISRILNPNDREDRDYLRGIPESSAELGEDETWFAIFLRVQNQTDEPLPAATDFEITSADEQSFSPIPLDPEQNVYAYDGGEISAGDQLPEIDSGAENNNPVRGEMLLFKLPFEALQNRPLEFHIKPTSGDEGIVDIDV